jgi:bifunctional DNase/RNase
VELIGVRVEIPTNTPVVILREVGDHPRTMTIFIGGPEATAIAFALEGVETPRPLTHDLTLDLLALTGHEIHHVVVTELRDTTFFAEIHLGGAPLLSPEDCVVSARPSDAIALAARADCPIFVQRELLDQVGFHEELDTADGEERPSEEVVEEFRAFIDQVSPDDFGS